MSLRGWIIGLISLLMLQLGCQGKKGIQGPPGPFLLEVYANLSTPYSAPYYDSTGFFNLSFSHSYDIPTVQVNGHNMVYDYQYGYWSRHFTIAPGDSFNINVYFEKPDGNLGETYASGMIPRQFQIESHDTSITDSISIGNDLNFIWSHSEGAEFYHVTFLLDYWYFVNGYADSNYYYYLDSVLTDTSIFIPATNIFPDLIIIDSISSSGGDFRISANIGPTRSREESDFKGDGFGFVRATSNGGRLNLAVKKIRPLR